MKTYTYFWWYIAHFFLALKIFRTNFVEKIKTHILHWITFFLKSCLLWDNVGKYLEPGRLQTEIWRMCIACSMLKTTKSNLASVIIIASLLQQWLQELVSILRHTYIAYLVRMWYEKIQDCEPAGSNCFLNFMCCYE